MPNHVPCVYLQYIGLGLIKYIMLEQDLMLKILILMITFSMKKLIYPKKKEKFQYYK